MRGQRHRVKEITPLFGNRRGSHKFLWKLGKCHVAGPDEWKDAIDARGLKCPMPVVLLGRRMARTAPGGLVTLIADDPASRLDIPVWCARNGHQVEADGPWKGDAAAHFFTILACGAGPSQGDGHGLP